MAINVISEYINVLNALYYYILLYYISIRVKEHNVRFLLAATFSFHTKY